MFSKNYSPSRLLLSSCHPRKMTQTPDRSAISIHPKDSKSDILFRLNFSPIREKETNIEEVLSIFEKPFAYLSIPDNYKQEFQDHCLSLRSLFKVIKTTNSGNKATYESKFWDEWKKFDQNLHEIAQKSAIDYCHDQTISLICSLDELIQRVNVHAPSNPALNQDHQIIYLKLYQEFTIIRERLFEIFSNKSSDSAIIQDLESSRNQLRQFRSNISYEYSNFFSLTKMPKLQQNQVKDQMISSFTSLILCYSNLKKQYIILNNIDLEIKRCMPQLRLMISGKPHSPCTQRRGKLSKENNPENQYEFNSISNILDFPEIPKNKSILSSSKRKEDHPVKVINDYNTKNDISSGILPSPNFDIINENISENDISENYNANESQSIINFKVDAESQTNEEFLSQPNFSYHNSIVTINCFDIEPTQDRNILFKPYASELSIFILTMFLIVVMNICCQ